MTRKGKLLDSFRLLLCSVLGMLFALAGGKALEAQSVCLPLPRLLTLMPCGGQVGGEFEVVIGGDHIDQVSQLFFNHPGIVAVPVVDEPVTPREIGAPRENRFRVTIAGDTPEGVYEAQVVSRLGVSSVRAFVVGDLSEVVREKPNTSLETSMTLAMNMVCNAYVSPKAIDYYRFEAEAGKRYVIRCAARGIDSKLDPVMILGDDQGRDLIADRLGQGIDWVADSTDIQTIKVHDLTFNGGTPYFYRLEIREIGLDAVVPPLPATRSIAAFSWPPVGVASKAALQEQEPGDGNEEVQAIELPCDIAGTYYPAADVDTYSFAAKAGEQWWIEVASERLGRPTDPNVLVQKVTQTSEGEVISDVIELLDIASPMKPSSNGYAYDGPPYNGGSLDVLGKLDIKEDGNYRIVLTDLFGGTRNDRRNIYRLIVRKAAPDFALAGWGLHMELRNGDRNALSKPLAMRAGGTMALEVVAVRRDGFDGPIELEMTGLPEGVYATGFRIPQGKTRGIVLVSAEEGAPENWTQVKLEGTAIVGGNEVRRPVHVGQVAWPIPDSWGEIPRPRLIDTLTVSVTQSEVAPLTIAPTDEGEIEAEEGAVLRIPLTLTKRGEFSGTVLQLRTFGDGFEGNPRADISLNESTAEMVVDLAKLKVPAGSHTIAFYGPVVAKYQYNPQAVFETQKRLEEAQAAESIDESLVKQLTEKLKSVTEQAKPRDTVDIVVSKPISIRILPKANP